jgi:hypothetical protein
LVNRKALRSFFGDAAAKLPPHQRVQLGVFVDRPVDRDELSGFFEREHVIVQIRISTGRGGDGSRLRFGNRVPTALTGEIVGPCRRVI